MIALEQNLASGARISNTCITGSSDLNLLVTPLGQGLIIELAGRAAASDREMPTINQNYDANVVQFSQRLHSHFLGLLGCHLHAWIVKYT